VKNPVLEESVELLLYRREALKLHAGYLILLSVFLVIAWPARSYMYFFRTESVPPAFLANTVFLILLSALMSFYLGLDRMAHAQTMRYTEWIERTTVPVKTLASGKLTTAVVHTGILVLLGAPMLIASAGPSGVPLSVLPGLGLVIFLSTLSCRLAAMLVSHLGEESYVIRTVGIWVYVALLFVLSLRVFRPIHPIVAALEQIAVGAPGALEGMQRETGNARAVGIISLSILIAVLAASYWISLHRHRVRAKRRRT
jgi:hypothetical protein